MTTAVEKLVYIFRLYTDLDESFEFSPEFTFFKPSIELNKKDNKVYRYLKPAQETNYSEIHNDFNKAYEAACNMNLAIDNYAILWVQIVDLNNEHNRKDCYLEQRLIMVGDLKHNQQKQMSLFKVHI